MIIEKYIQRCIELGNKGLGKVAPNPLVGSVITYKDSIIGKGFHEYFGGPHAEVNAINSVSNDQLLAESVLYVNLEPCSHHGKTPPCADLIIAKGIKKVVIGTVDPNPKVAGKGIEKLRSAGIEVVVGVLENECKALNNYFFTFYTKHRPYIILKWAQSADGFIAPSNQNVKDPLKISNPEAQKQVHTWRSEVQAILVGKNTIILDDPQLNTRLIQGKSPIPMVFASQSEVPPGYKILNSNPVFFEKSKESLKNLTSYCSQNNIQSVLVEGGAKILQLFLEKNVWDEIRMITNLNLKILDGVKAPEIAMSHFTEMKCGDDNSIKYFKNPFIHD